MWVLLQVAGCTVSASHLMATNLPGLAMTPQLVLLMLSITTSKSFIQYFLLQTINIDNCECGLRDVLSAFINYQNLNFDRKTTGYTN